MGKKNSQRLEIYGSRGGLIYTLENGLRGSDHLKVCLGNELALTGDWVDMNLKGFDGVYNTKSQMDCFAEKCLELKIQYRQILKMVTMFRESLKL